MSPQALDLSLDLEDVDYDNLEDMHPWWTSCSLFSRNVAVSEEFICMIFFSNALHLDPLRRHTREVVSYLEVKESCFLTSAEEADSSSGVLPASPDAG